MDKKKLRNDLILIGALLTASAVALTVILLTRVKKNLTAKIYSQNKVVEVVDLNQKEERTFKIKGLHGLVYVHCLYHKVGITKSNCPHQDCVHMGYVSNSNQPIICAYNAVSVIIEGSTVNDVVIG